jgi:hypothetical protein
MNHAAIISRGESLRILRNDLRKAALEKQAAELANAMAEQREKIITLIEQNIQKELRRRMTQAEPPSLVH